MEDGLEDITRVLLGEREIILVGTAHISQQSVDTVKRIIEEERPDVVCVELDAQRLKAMRERQRWEELDLKQVIKEKKLMFLMARLALASFQKRMGSYTGVQPGAEMSAAIDVAEAQGARLELIDRDVQTTLLRAWRRTPWYRRSMLALELLGGTFEKTEVNEAELANLRNEDNITGVLDQIGEVLPEVKEVLVDERDLFMSHGIQQCGGEKVVVVIGAAHKPGITKELAEPIPYARVAAVEVIPERGAFSKIAPWLIPAIIIGAFVYAYYQGKFDELYEASIAWILVNGVLAALGTAIAKGHPLTVITAFIAAPITSLNPTIGAGMVTAFAQATFAPPKVKDMERVGDDIAEWRGWWSNKLARLFLVFLFSTIGSAIGTFASIYWLKDLI